MIRARLPQADGANPGSFPLPSTRNLGIDTSRYDEIRASLRHQPPAEFLTDAEIAETLTWRTEQKKD